MKYGFFALLALALIGFSQAFMPAGRLPVRAPIKAAPRGVRALNMVEETTYWEGKAPKSIVLGPLLQNVPSGLLGPVSLVFLIVGSYCVHESNIFNVPTLDTINPVYFLGSFLTPISWGLHVAAWIQKQNGK